MKTMRNTLLLATVAAGFAAASAAQASVVDIQFEGTNNVGSQGGSFSGNKGAYTGDSVASPIWNVLSVAFASTSGSANALEDSTGVVTSDAVSYVTSGSWSDTTETPANALLSGYLFNTSSSTEAVTLTGLTDNGAYQLYLYGQDGGSTPRRGASFSITTGTGSADTLAGSDAYTTNAGSGNFTLNQNYVIFNAIADATGTLAISWTQPPSGGGEGDFNGLQVITVPEPATLGLVALGALGLLLIKRRPA